MYNGMINEDSHPAKTIRRSKKLLLICFLLITSILLSSCEAIWQYKANLYRIRDFSSAVADEFGKLSIKDCIIDDEEKTFTITYSGPKTIAEFDQIREAINSYLAKNPDFFLNDGYSVTVYFDIGSRRNFVSNNIMLTNRKQPFDEDNDKLYESLAYMEIGNSFDSGYTISQLEGHCTTLKGIALNGVPLDDVEVLKNLPELESVDLISGYSNSERSQLQLALPECEVTSVQQTA